MLIKTTIPTAKHYNCCIKKTFTKQGGYSYQLTLKDSNRRRGGGVGLYPCKTVRQQDESELAKSEDNKYSFVNMLQTRIAMTCMKQEYSLAFTVTYMVL